MWISYREMDRRNACFVSLGLKPRLPMSTSQKLKARIFGFFFKHDWNR